MWFRGGSRPRRPARGRPSPPQAFVHAAQVPTGAVAVLIPDLRLPRRLHGRGAVSQPAPALGPPARNTPLGSAARGAGPGCSNRPRTFPPGQWRSRKSAPPRPGLRFLLRQPWHSPGTCRKARSFRCEEAPRCQLFARPARGLCRPTASPAGVSPPGWSALGAFQRPACPPQGSGARARPELSLFSVGNPCEVSAIGGNAHSMVSRAYSSATRCFR